MDKLPAFVEVATVGEFCEAVKEAEAVSITNITTTPADIKKICESLKKAKQLKGLRLCKCRLRVADSLAIVRSIKGCKRLLVLDFSYNALAKADEFFQALGELLRKPFTALISLSFECCRLSDDDLEQILDCVSNSLSLIYLNLRKNAKISAPLRAQFDSLINDRDRSLADVMYPEGEEDPTDRKGTDADPSSVQHVLKLGVLAHHSLHTVADEVIASFCRPRRTADPLLAQVTSEIVVSAQASIPMRHRSASSFDNEGLATIDKTKASSSDTEGGRAAPPKSKKGKGSKTAKPGAPSGKKKKGKKPQMAGEASEHANTEPSTFLVRRKVALVDNIAYILELRVLPVPESLDYNPYKQQMRELDGMLILFDTGSAVSFDTAKIARGTLSRVRGQRNFPLVICGLHSGEKGELGMLQTRKVVSFDVGRDYSLSRENPFSEIDPLREEDVDLVFEEVVREIVRFYTNPDPMKSPNTPALREARRRFRYTQTNTTDIRFAEDDQPDSDPLPPSALDAPSASDAAPGLHAIALDKTLHAAAEPAGPSHAADPVTMLDPPSELEPSYVPGAVQLSLVVTAPPKIMAAKMHKIVERVTYERYPNMRLMSSFLLIAHSLLPAVELLDMLIERFRMRPPEQLALTASAGEDWRARVLLPVRARVVNVLKHWVESWGPQFTEDSALTAKAERFVASDVREAFPEQAAQVEKSLARARSGGSKFETFARSPLPSLVSKTVLSGMFNLLDVHPLELARQLTLKEHELLRRIPVRELLLSVKVKKEAKAQMCPHVVEAIGWFNALGSFVAAEVVRGETASRRAAVLARWVHVASTCVELCNFSTLMAVLSGMNDCSVDRLKVGSSRVDLQACKLEYSIVSPK